MERKDLQRTFWQRLFGLPATPQPADSGCWAFSGGKVVIDLGMAPELQKPGGALRLEGKGLLRRLLVLHGEDGGFRAFHNRCTHLGHRLRSLRAQTHPRGWRARLHPYPFHV